jgi:uncharacterized protein YabE (DUF348 family)
MLMKSVPIHARRPAGYAGLLTLALLALVGGMMGAAYLRLLVPVVLQVEGARYEWRTHRPTVESALQDAGVVVYAEDRITPSLAERIKPGEVIHIDRARPIRVHVDDTLVTGRSLKHSVPDILAELGVALSPYDKVVSFQEASEPPGSLTEKGGGALVATLPLGRSPASRVGWLDSSKPVLELIVKRAVAMELSLDGRPYSLHTTAPSVGEALREAGIVLHEADRVRPSLSASTQPGLAVVVKTATPLTILVDGRRLRARTHSANVADALAEANVALNGQDYTRPSLDSGLLAGMEIKVVRVRETFSIEQEPVPFEVLWMPDPELEIDHQALRQAGENGVLQKRIRVHYEDGQETSRRLEDQGIVRPPQNKIISYGTGVIVRTLDTPQGPVEYWRRVRMLATSYSASTAGTPTTASYYGRTRLGWTMGHGIVAVDPRVVQLGSRVFVPGYGMGAAGDTGGAIKGRRIDLGYDDHDLVLWYRWVDVYLLTPVPSDINYVIPDWPPEP